jgi:hypothetical protein
MKKTKIMTAAIALCMAATMFAGCSTNETVGETAVATRIEGGQTQIAIENSDVETGEAVRGYAFSHNGYEIGIGSNEELVFTAMGEPSDSEAVANCAGLGMGINNYYYDGRVFIQIADTTGTVTQIFISDPIIDCGGVAVGDSVDAVTSVYGEPSFQSEFIVEYKKDGMTLQFELENGKVSKIWYLENSTVE